MQDAPSTRSKEDNMHDATTPWVDPELIAAGKLLQERGLVAPDRTVAGLAEVRAMTDRIGAFLGEGSVPLKGERDLSLPGPHGQVPCRLYLPDGVERPPLKFQLLIYGCFSTDCDSPSWQRFGQGAGLSQAQMRWIWETYLAKPEQKQDWRAAPMIADLKGLAPAHLIVGSLDPLLDDSNNLAAKLKAAGVPCQLTVYQGINHGFIRYGRLIGTARRAVADCAAALKAGLAG